MSRQTALWALAALLGLVLTAGITWATSQLTSQHIGLSSEPISGGRSLAPAVTEQGTSRHTTTRKRSAPARRRTTSTGAGSATPSEASVPQLTTPSSTGGGSSPPSSTSVKRTTTRRPTGPTRDDSAGDGGGGREAGAPAAGQSPSRKRDD